jgi:nitroreductase
VSDFKELFNLPEHIIPFSLLPIGYPAEVKGKADRYTEEKVHYNKW